MGRKNTSLDENTIREILGKDYDEYNVSVNNDITENIAAIILEKDGLTKIIYYDYNLSRPITNKVDATYFCVLGEGNYYTLHSYQIEDTVRVFMGITDIFEGKVLPIGYDLNKKSFINFPLNDDGLINDDEMLKKILRERPIIGYDFIHYKRVLKTEELCYLLRDLKVCREICDELIEHNENKEKEKKI